MLNTSKIPCKDLISCTGCRACEQLCPTNCIRMVSDNEGFLVPEIDRSACTDCGVCSERCPAVRDYDMDDRQPPDVYAAVLRDDEKLFQSASGGAFSALAGYVFDKGGVVFGCAFDENLMAHHTMAHNWDELAPMRGSKYVQSDTRDTYTEAKKRLQSGQVVLYTGTPCQIAGLKAFLGNAYETLLTADLICHGTPSPWLLREHIGWLQHTQNVSIQDISFRFKGDVGWGNGYRLEYTGTHASGEPFVRACSSSEDCYIAAFGNDTALREACYQCKYTNDRREGDFTLADYWGVQTAHPDIPTKQGVSLLLVNTQKAANALQEIDTLALHTSTLEKAKAGQRNLDAPSNRSPARSTFYKQIQQHGYAWYAKRYFRSLSYLKRRVAPFVSARVKKLLKKLTILNGTISRSILQ